MVETWDFRIMGSLEVRRAGAAVPLPAAKHRIILASLLLRPNRVVSTDDLYVRLWGAEPPPGAKKTLHGYVARLRRTLDSTLVETRSHGYLISIEPEMLDIVRFEALLEEAERAHSQPERVAVLLRQALEMWRGEPLADVPSELLQRTDATALAERRLHVLEWCIGIDIALGRHAARIPELHEMVSLHPHREQLWSHLMLALYRSGRQADALDAYRRARALFVDELGIEPGPELQQLQQRILSGDSCLPSQPGSIRVGVGASGPGAPAPADPAGSAVPVPAELPPHIADFTGRSEPVSTLEGVLRSAPRDTERPATLAAVVGPAGAGKSTLAVHVAHRVRDRFPDGQLYARLRTGGVAADPRDVLAHFLRALGVATEALPDSLDERSALYRSRMAGQAILVVLDDVASEAQIRPMIPGSAPAATLVTARFAPAGLEGAHQLWIGRFDRTESVDLLTAIVGADRVRAEPAAAETIVELCCRLPLALRIAGVRLASRPYRRLSWLVDRLDDRSRRLDELVAGDLDLRASLRISWDALPADAHRAGIAIGRRDETAVDVPMVGRQLGLPEAETRELLDVLVEQQILEVDGCDEDGHARYMLRELDRLYAAERGAAGAAASARRGGHQRTTSGTTGEPPRDNHRL